MYYHKYQLNSFCPTDFLLKVDVVKMSCGNYHLAVLTNEGQLYTWGRGNHGQLGLGNLQDWYVRRFFRLEHHPFISIRYV
jgi:alpha-tubulin suppressor-like RCC1 family protein